jgi:iron complex transport system substrate-binding protein
VKHRLALGLALLLLLAGCARSSSAPAATPPSSATGAGSAFPLTITDDDGEAVTIPTEPQRIITYAPSMTEILFALGVGDRIVGVAGAFDDYPAEAQGIEEVGGAGDFGVDPNVEKVVALEPDLLLTIAGGDAWKKQLRDLGVPVVTYNATDFDDLLADIGAIGKVVGAPDGAAQVVEGMQATADDVAATAETEGRVSCFFEVFFGPELTTIGPNTFIFDLLERAGCDPVTASAKSDYPQWSVDELVADSPDVYLATPESAKSVAAIARRPGFADIDAVAEGRVVLIDSDLVTRPGPRVVEGLEQLAAALHGSA